MKKKYSIRLINILIIIFAIFCSSPLEATVLDGGIEWQTFVDDFTAKETYTISVPKNGGQIPKTRDLCYQGPLSYLYYGSMKYHTISISCEYKERVIQITSMCIDKQANRDISYAFFSLENDDRFNLTLMCEKR